MFRLLCTLAIISCVHGYDKPYNLIPITSPILQEELFKARLYHEIWTTVHFIDILDLQKSADQVKIKIEDLLYKCHKFDFCDHTMTLNTINNRFHNIEQKLDSLYSLSNHKRQKRGLFNVVGTIQHFLFGTMSADDAERINKQIDDVYNNTANIEVLLNNQTVIMKTTLRKFMNITDNYEKNLKIMNITINKMNKVNLEKTFNTKMTECIIDLNLHIADLVENVNLIYDSIFDGKLGIVSPRLISPKSFINGLHTIYTKLFHQDLPFPLDENYYVMYMKISDINVILSNGKLIYVFHTPIPSSSDYTVYKFTPIPMPGWTQYYIFDNIENQPVAVDSNLTEYSIIDLNACKSMNDVKMCEITSVVHRFTLEESCYVRLLKHKDDKGCSRKYFNLKAHFILALSNGFSWYILPINTENIIITCGLSRDTSVSITKPHILELDSNCKGYSKYHKYLPKSHVNTSKISAYKIDIQFLPIEQIALNISDLKLPTFTSFHVDTAEILNSAKTIEEITKEVEIITSNHNYRARLTMGYSIVHYIIYTIAIISILYVLYKTIHRKCPKCITCKNNDDQRNEDSATANTQSNIANTVDQRIEDSAIVNIQNNVENRTETSTSALGAIVRYIPSAPTL